MPQEEQSQHGCGTDGAGKPPVATEQAIDTAPSWCPIGPPATDVRVASAAKARAQGGQGSARAISIASVGSGNTVTPAHENVAGEIYPS